MPSITENLSITSQHPVAYFCAEFGFDGKIPIYAGGLGVLAGDTLKQAADNSFPMVGVGLLYRGYGMKQYITMDGDQIDQDWLFDPLSVGFEHVYVDEMPLFIKVHLTEVDIWLRCWKKTFDNDVVLYLLDSDTDQNQLHERSITQVLYSGTRELQVKQQLILGIGGIKLLSALGIHPALYHLNEGRPAFLHWQLIRQFMDTHKIDYYSAKKLAREKVVYTNHTLVAAGNQNYPMNVLRMLAGYYANKMHISVDELLREGIDTDPEQFSVTKFALNVSRKASGVSQLHTKLSQESWPQYSWTNITNGVHLPTWQSSEIVAAQDDFKKLWLTHLVEKQKLAQFVQNETGYTYDSNRLVIVWARRNAGYKQLPLLFSDLEKLRGLIKNADRPVQILVSGKAHQGDIQGKASLKEIIGHMQHELSGNALFIPNYNLDIARNLVRGADIWLNTPIFGQEACGTSGMKACSNGVIQCTVPDGWAAEVKWDGVGWSLNTAITAAGLYELLEQQIIPHYYSRSSEGIPIEWVKKMRASIQLANTYSAARMLREYQNNLYTP